MAIDDDEVALMWLEASIKHVMPSAKLLTAPDGEAGLGLAQSVEPDVILLDIEMPGMDGYEVCRKLKKGAATHFIPVVFLTALRTDKDSRIKALEAGAEGFLSKPLDSTELVAQIRAMVKVKAANMTQQRQKEHLAALVAERTHALEQELAERRKVESALQESHGRLEQIVADRTRRLRQLASELTVAEQRERRRIASFLHDDLQQVQAAAMLSADKLAAEPGGDAMQDEVAKLRAYLVEAIAKTRSVSNELAPSLLYMAGMEPALRQLASLMRDRHDLQVDLDINDDLDPLSEDVRVQVFNSVRELLFNVTKHADTRFARVRVRMKGDRVEISVSDKGRGFTQPKSAPLECNAGGCGLFRISEQLDNIGGGLDIVSKPGRGTRVKMTVPVFR